MIPNRNSLKILLEIPIKILRIGKSNAIFSEFYNIFFFLSYRYRVSKALKVFMGKIVGELHIRL